MKYKMGYIIEEIIKSNNRYDYNDYNLVKLLSYYIQKNNFQYIEKIRKELEVDNLDDHIVFFDNILYTLLSWDIKYIEEDNLYEYTKLFTMPIVFKNKQNNDIKISIKEKKLFVNSLKHYNGIKNNESLYLLPYFYNFNTLNNYLSNKETMRVVMKDINLVNNYLNKGLEASVNDLSFMVMAKKFTTDKLDYKILFENGDEQEYKFINLTNKILNKIYNVDNDTDIIVLGSFSIRTAINFTQSIYDNILFESFLQNFIRNKNKEDVVGVISVEVDNNIAVNLFDKEKKYEQFLFHEKNNIDILNLIKRKINKYKIKIVS